MAQRIRELDWSNTPLGAVEYWPESLRTALAICLKSGFATYVWWGPALIQFYNDASIRSLHGKHPSALGRPSKESWREVWDDIAPFMERALHGEPVFVQDFEIVPERDDTLESAYFTFSLTPLTEEGGEIAGVFITAVETTDKVRAQIASRRDAQRLRAVIDSATEYAILTLDAKGRISSWNSGAERLLGYREEEVLGQSGEIFFTPGDRAAGKPELEMAQTRESGSGENERWHMRKDGSLFWGSGVMLPLEGDKRDRYLKILQDRSKLHYLQERQHLLTQELNHRIKNTLAMVQSVAMQSLRRSDCSVEARESLESRLVALAKAHDVLTADNWRGGDLRLSLEAVLRLVAEDTFDARIHLEGPGVHLTPGALVGLSLAFHELATNAVKYGALSNDSGRIDVQWHIEEGEERCFGLQWIERGGPPVEPPTRKGFGSRVIAEGLAQEFGGTVRWKFAKEGLECSVRAALKAVTGEC